MKKKATIYDIAKELNVTVSTVSRALNHSKIISKSTTDAVWETAKKLNYTPNRLAASLKSGKTFTIGVIIPSTGFQFFGSVIHSIEQALKNEGYGILLYQSNEKVETEKQGVKTLLEAQVDGIIASLSLETVDVSHFKEVINQGKALVLFDRTKEELPVPFVSIDDYRAGYMATEHLIKKGFKKITFIAHSPQIINFKRRIDGFLDALKDYKIPEYSNNLIFGDITMEGGKKEAERILKLKNKPDAIIAADDFVGLGLFQKFKEHSVSDIAIMGFANEVFSEFITPSLTTIEQQPHKMGAECARIFLSMIKKKKLYENPERVILDPILIERESTRREENI